LDNLTHSLVGLAAAKAGFEKLSPRAMAVCLIAANIPDLDIVVLLFGGRWELLKHHRGFTHSIAGTVLLASVLPLLFYLVGYVAAKTRSRLNPIKLKGLLLASLLTAATHPFMDWTNNYGIRLLLPWSSRWFYGDLVFIVDPFLWLIFGGAAFLLTARSRIQLTVWIVLGLVVSALILFGSSQRGGVSDPTFIRIFWLTVLILVVVLYQMGVARRWGAKVALASFIIAGFYWGSLAYAHHLAVNQAQPLATMIANQNGESVTQLAVMPTLANPFQWQTVFETDRASYRFDLRLTSPPDLSKLIRYEKPPPSAEPVISKALEDPRARILMDFARFPVIRVDPNCVSNTLVQFADLRYTEPGGGRGTFSLEVPIDCPAGTVADPK